jgi:hypothetical protein
MLIWVRGLTGDRRPPGDWRWIVEEGNDPPRGDAYVYTLREEEAYLQTDEDEKPASLAEPDPASFRCWFCWKTNRQVLWGAKYPVRDPQTFAFIAQVFICDECVARFADSSAWESEGPPPY